MAPLVRSEAAKLLGLPSTGVAAAVSLLLTPALAALNSFSYRSVGVIDPAWPGDTTALDLVTPLLPTVGAVGPIIVAVMAMSSEHRVNSDVPGGGRQLLVTLLATPRRWRVMAAKVVVVAVFSTLLAAMTTVAVLATADLVLGEVGPTTAGALGDPSWSPVGVVLYIDLLALMALAIATLARSGLLPLVVLLVNGTLVSVSLLVGKVTPAARFLPDAAGMSLTGLDQVMPFELLDPVAGGLAMSAWTAVLLGLATVAFTVRDA